MKEKPKIADNKQQSPGTHPSPGVPGEYPSPSALLELAEREQPRLPVKEYAEVISKLREEKGLSYREIAEWLSEKGVPMDHNEVYRAHKDWCEAAPKRYFERKLRSQPPAQS